MSPQMNIFATLMYELRGKIISKQKRG